VSWTLQGKQIFPCKNNTFRNNTALQLKDDLSYFNGSVLLDGLLDIGAVEGILFVPMEGIEVDFLFTQLIFDNLQ
jgi:hypothetical protein